MSTLELTYNKHVFKEQSRELQKDRQYMLSTKFGTKTI